MLLAMMTRIEFFRKLLGRFYRSHFPRDQEARKSQHGQKYFPKVSLNALFQREDSPLKKEERDGVSGVDPVMVRIVYELTSPILSIQNRQFGVKTISADLSLLRL